MQDTTDPHQFGSLTGGRSTIHVPVELVRQCQQALDKPGKMVRALMLDYIKGFDQAGHNTLLRKLANLGLPNFNVRRVTNFHAEGGSVLN